MAKTARGSSAGRNPVYRFGLMTFGLAIALAAILFWWVHAPDPLTAWLIAITLVTFLTYGYDKAIAGSRLTRVPESLLLLLTGAGGTAGALVGMRLFHHKTAKGRFLRRFWLVAAAQLVFLLAYYLWLKPRIAGG